MVNDIPPRRPTPEEDRPRSLSDLARDLADHLRREGHHPFVWGKGETTVGINYGHTTRPPQTDQGSGPQLWRIEPNTIYEQAQGYTPDFDGITIEGDAPVDLTPPGKTEGG